ncbi:MAG: energy transducer TonB [Betaproteobacteria bacterium]|nr:energy transducer TonB [Betaproteobacteria bacterium]
MGLLPAGKVVPLGRRARRGRHAPWSRAAAEFDLRLAELERRVARIDHRLAGLAVTKRIQLAVLLSIAIHATVIAGVSFKVPGKDSLSNLNQPLEVVLVNAKSPNPPPQPDALAQENLDGGGNTDAPRRAKSPLPAKHQEKEGAEAAATRRVEQREREARQLLTQARAQAPVETAAPQVAQPESDTPPAPNASELMQRSLEIARLEAQISKDWDSYQKRPRRRFIGARTQEFRFARYIEDWRLKIERVGELNYPQAARDQRLYGSLVVTVSIKADGVLEKVEINRPSGWKVLDEAALRIVKLAAPFAPFPADISRDTDILSITRTWTFTRSDQLVTD